MTQNAAAQGVLMLCQQGLTPIDQGHALDALPDAMRRGPRDIVSVDSMDANARAVESHDWHEAGRELADEYRRRVQPILHANPGYRVAYFGTVSIPLAFQLGYHVSTWRAAEAFLHHHRRKDWRWADGERERPTPEVHVGGVPPAGSQAEGDLVVRVSTSHRVHSEQTREVVPRPLAEVDISLAALGEDALERLEDLQAVAEAFKFVLDRLRELFPNAETAHVFAAVPVGLAFLLGTRVSPMIHPTVQTYQFDSRSVPKYHAALRLQSEAAPTLALSDDERIAAARERAIWAEELDRLKKFASNMPDHAGGWLADVLPAEGLIHFGGSWPSLPRLKALELCHSSIDANATSAPGGFRYVPTDRKWVLADDFLVPLMRRVADEGDRRRAARLFLLHEGLHLWQALTAWTSPGIGRFAKVLEEIDYVADVWALLHEGKLAAAENGAPADGPIFLRSLIKLAVETMLSFDDGPAPALAMQVRRVARYLIWSWQYLETERLAPNDDPWRVLATKPLIELAGPEIRARDERVWYLLDPAHTHAAEVALYRSHRLLRFPAGPSTPHEEILEALRTRQGDRMRSALRGVFDQARGMTG
ncbi:MAG TPA: SAVED domain-containing protein [Polyangia bacterium]|nr:SAVED domain-containing protein [Polyangia bacterium]